MVIHLETLTIRTANREKVVVGYDGDFDSFEAYLK